MDNPASFFIRIFTEDYGPKIGKAFAALFPDPSVKVTYSDAVKKLNKILLGKSKPRKFKATRMNSRSSRLKLLVEK